MTLSNKALGKNDFEQGIEEVSKYLNLQNKLWWFKPVIDRILKLRQSAEKFDNEKFVLYIHKNNVLDYTVNFDYILYPKNPQDNSLTKSGIVFACMKRK